MSAVAHAEEEPQPQQVSRARPTLAVFYSPTSGRCRRVDAYVAQVLQRRRNHRAFALRRVSSDERPDLHERFGIEQVPTLVVIEGRRVRARLESPPTCVSVERFLAPWLDR